MQSETASTKSALNKSSPWLLFQVGNIGCAVSITDVQIVITEPKLTQLPACNAEYPGVFNHAGETFQVVDLHYKFMSKPCKQAKLILSQEADGRYAYRVSSVAAVMSIAETSWLYQKELPGKVFNGVFAHEKHMVLCAEIAKLRKMSAQNIEAFIKSNTAKLGIAAPPESKTKNSHSDTDRALDGKSQSIISAKESQITQAKQLIEKNDGSTKFKTSSKDAAIDKTAIVDTQQSAAVQKQTQNDSEQKTNSVKSTALSVAAPVITKYAAGLSKGVTIDNKSESISSAIDANSVSMPKPAWSQAEKLNVEKTISVPLNAVVATKDENSNNGHWEASSKPVSDAITSHASVVGKATNRKATEKNVVQSHEFDQAGIGQKQEPTPLNANAVSAEPATNGVATLISFSVLGLLLLAGLIWLIPWLVSELLSKSVRPEPYVSQLIEKEPMQSEEVSLPVVSETAQVVPPTYDVIATMPAKQESASLPSAVMNDADSLDAHSETNISKPAQDLSDVRASETETQIIFEPIEALPVETMIEKQPSKTPASVTSENEKIAAPVNGQEGQLQEPKTETDIQLPVTELPQTETIAPVIEMDTAVTESGNKSIVINIIDARAKFRGNTAQSVSNQSSVSMRQQRVHTVVSGDTLWHIAKHYLTNPYRYPELARLSEIANPDLIYPGDNVIIRISAE